VGDVSDADSALPQPGSADGRPSLQTFAHGAIKAYDGQLASYAAHAIVHEGAASSAFQNLLAAMCSKTGWRLVPQLATKIRGKQVRPDGTLCEDFNLHGGYWEAKDTGRQARR
jgi:hypothetical protein